MRMVLPRESVRGACVPLGLAAGLEDLRVGMGRMVTGWEGGEIVKWPNGQMAK